MSPPQCIALATVALLLAPARPARPADCNGNGIPDEIDVIPNQFALAPPLSQAVGVNPGSLCQGDLDGDGDRDLAVTNGADGAVSILLNQGAGTFVQSVRYPVVSGLGGVQAVDLDGDGDPDLAAVSGTRAYILLNQGNSRRFVSAWKCPSLAGPGSMSSTPRDAGWRRFWIAR